MHPKAEVLPARRLLAAACLVALLVLGQFATGVGATRAHADVGVGSVTFIMLNPQKDKLPLAGVEVTLVAHDAGATTVTTVTDSSGRARFAGIPASDWSATVTPPQAGGATRLPTTIATVAVGAGSTTYRDVVLRIGASIGGTLRNEYGAELPGVAVALRVGKTSPVVGRAVTDSRGHFWIRGVATGSYSLQYNPPQGIPRPYQTAYDTWSFWGHTPGTAFSFALIHVVNATAGNAQSKLDHQDGVVVEGSILEVDIAKQGTTRLDKATLTYAGESLGSTFTFPVAAGNSTGAYGYARVVPGRYKVSFTGTTPAGAPITYYYTGLDSRGFAKPPSLSPTDAAWVTFTTADTLFFPAT